MIGLGDEVKGKTLILVEPKFPHLDNKYPTLYETQRFITVFTRAQNLSPSYAK
jgi:hypothetical protein